MNHTPNDFRVFGSPVYILDPTLQSGTLSPGKWKERSYQGVYIGHLLHHANNVILVYNPKTRLVSPQYHVIHDESFETVQINTSEAEAQQKLDEMLNALFITSQMDTQWCIHQLWSFNHTAPLSWQQLGFCQWNRPCYLSKEMCPWLVTPQNCRLWGRYLQHKSCSGTVIHWATFETGGPSCTSSGFNTCSSFQGSSVLRQWSWEPPNN